MFAEARVGKQQARSMSFSTGRRASAPQGTEEALRQGFLLKRGEINKGWKVRWCALQNRQLLYFKSPEHTKQKPIATIPLEDAVVRESSSEKSDETAFAFEVVTRSRVYVLAAKTHQDRSEWIAAMSQFTSLHKENAMMERAEDWICELALQRAEEEERKMRSYLARKRAGTPRSDSGEGAVSGGGIMEGSPTRSSGSEHTAEQETIESAPIAVQSARDGSGVAQQFLSSPTDIDAFARALTPALFTAVGVSPATRDGDKPR